MGCLARPTGSRALQSGSYAACSAPVIDGTSLVVPARRQPPESLHALYCSVVTSSLSMQNGRSVTWCCGFSFGASFEPMKKRPPGIAIMSAGQPATADALDDAEALAGGADVAPDDAVVVPEPPPRRAKNATPPPIATTTAPPITMPAKP